jgi:uncharacterized membrane protein YphA (DoxX/SURF4 family)
MRNQEKILGFGKYFFAAGIVFLGAQYFVYGRYSGGLPPVPPWAPGGAAGAYLAGSLLIATAAGIAFDVKRRWSALVLGSFLLFCVVILHAQKIGEILTSGTARTRALEPLAVCGAALSLIGSLPAPDGTRGSDPRIVQLGRILFAFSMIIFGVQHFEYLKFVAALIPSWIPGHVFWVVFTGVGFVAAGVAIGTGYYGRLAATWLGIMFLLWFVLLHIPLALASPKDGNKWSSMFVALAMSGASFIVAKSLPDGRAGFTSTRSRPLRTGSSRRS